MTPERAAYHYIMLSVGLRDAFDRDFDEALETEDPLSDLTVRLCAAPPSDADACRSVLMNFFCDFSVDSRAVFDLTLADVRRRWYGGELTDRELAELGSAIDEEVDPLFPAPWGEFSRLWYNWDCMQRGEMPRADFLQDMDVFFRDGECPVPHPRSEWDPGWRRSGMSPERSAYHALMLHVGLRDVFDRDFDVALEQEEPLSPLTLALTSATTDINRTISLLREHCRENPTDIDAVYDLVWQDLCLRFRGGSLTDLELINLAWTLSQTAEEWFGADWEDFRTLEYHYETWLDGLIPEERYLQCRELFLTRRTCSTDPEPPQPEKTLLQRIRDFFKH